MWIKKSPFYIKNEDKVPIAGIEPTASTLSEWRSNLLSYMGILKRGNNSDWIRTSDLRFQRDALHHLSYECYSLR